MYLNIHYFMVLANHNTYLIVIKAGSETQDLETTMRENFISHINHRAIFWIVLLKPQFKTCHYVLAEPVDNLTVKQVFWTNEQNNGTKMRILLLKEVSQNKKMLLAILLWL